MSQEKIMGIIRHTLTFAGGFIIQGGYATEDLTTEAIGGAISLVGLIWSIVKNAKAKKK